MKKNSSTDRPCSGFHFLCSKYSFGRNGSRQSKTVFEMANVMAVNQTTKAMDAYAITTDKGKFSLNLKTNTTYVIKIIWVQNKSHRDNLAENMEQNITMESGGIELDGVEIVREMPVSIKEILLFTIQIRLKQAKSSLKSV
jgi:hypothetical protein